MAGTPPRRAAAASGQFQTDTLPDRTIAPADQMRSDAPGDLLGAEPIDGERQVRAVLLDRPERQQHHRPPIARQLAHLGVSAVRSPDDSVTGEARRA